MLKFTTILEAGEISGEDIIELCRTCLMKKYNQISIFSTNVLSKKSYADMLMECSPVQISPSDHFPSNICRNCVKSLQIAYSFQQQCFAADTLLQYFSSGYLENIDNGQEKNDDSLSVSHDSQLELQEDEFDHTIKKENLAIIDSYNLNQVNVISSLKSLVLKEMQIVGDRTPEEAHPRKTVVSLENSDHILTDTQDLNVKHKTVSVGETSKNVPGRLRTKSQKRPKQFRCNVCSKVFSLNNRLKRHMIIHTRVVLPKPKKIHRCSTCQQVFKSSSRLSRHMNVHTKAATIFCDICGLRLSNASNLKRHSKIHTGEKDFKCDICGKGFIQKSAMLAHRDCHNVEKRFKCELCEKPFRTRIGKNVHRETHNTDKRFKCKWCKKTFRTRAGAYQHERMHFWKHEAH